MSGRPLHQPLVSGRPSEGSLALRLATRRSRGRAMCAGLSPQAPPARGAVAVPPRRSSQARRLPPRPARLPSPFDAKENPMPRVIVTTRAPPRPRRAGRPARRARLHRAPLQRPRRRPADRAAELGDPRRRARRARPPRPAAAPRRPARRRGAPRARAPLAQPRPARGPVARRPRAPSRHSGRRTALCEPRATFAA